MQTETQKQGVEHVSIEQDDSFSVDVSATSIGGVDELHSTLDDVADSFDVTGFKCTQCGLAHMHDTTKHRLSDSFDVDESIAGDMEMGGGCHCGVHEMARRGSEFGIDESQADSIAGDAPIPPETQTMLDNEFGSR